MNQDDNVQVLLHIRKLRGGSQPILVRANDGFFYVVKFLDNLQGANVLFNEALGTELFRRAGLPVPEWRPVFVSEDFLDRNPECWMETEHGRYRPQSGYCFGSRYLGLRDADLFEILPERSFSRIKNCRDFWTARVLDVLCGHTDNRQALFLQRNSGPLEAYFIDHGHLFGGARGNESPRMMASRYLDSRIYAVPAAEDVQRIQEVIQRIDLSALFSIACSLPDGWNNEIAMANFERFACRIADAGLLKDVIRAILCEVKHTGNIYERSYIKAEYAGLHASVPASKLDDRVKARHGDFAGDQRWRWSQSLCLPSTYPANSRAR
jgi:hypothetical protein